MYILLSLGKFHFIILPLWPYIDFLPNKEKEKELPSRLWFSNNTNSNYHLLSTYYIPDSMLRNFIDSTSVNPHKNPLRGHYYFPHFVNEETEIYKDWVTLPKVTGEIKIQVLMVPSPAVNCHIIPPPICS